jgi:hypothetical protein
LANKRKRVEREYPEKECFLIEVFDGSAQNPGELFRPSGFIVLKSGRYTENQENRLRILEDLTLN